MRRDRHRWARRRAERRPDRPSALPRGGNPGVGKTTLAQHFLLDGLRRGERYLYITLAETEEELREGARSHGWSLDGIDIVELIDADADASEDGELTLFHPSKVELGDLTRRVFQAIEEANDCTVLRHKACRWQRMLAETIPFALKRVLDGASALLGDGNGAARGDLLRALSVQSLDVLPLPGAGHTLQRWRALAVVAGADLSLLKLYEGHTDALAILHEADASPQAEGTWGMWAAEAPGARVVFTPAGEGRCTLRGTKAWCSGARHLDRALLTVWRADGAGPFLAAVDLHQPGIGFSSEQWQAIGMAATDSHDVVFEDVPARLIGAENFYLSRPGFWQGGVGIAACWHGAACALADALRVRAMAAADPAWHRLLALGAIDRTLSANAALLREAAEWIDASPLVDAQAIALRTRSATEAAAEAVLHHVTRALGATPLCRDAAFARMAADLPVFIRQSHGDRDLVALGQAALDSEESAWTL